jgi:hypothetical protein
VLSATLTFALAAAAGDAAATDAAGEAAAGEAAAGEAAAGEAAAGEAAAGEAAAFVASGAFVGADVAAGAVAFEVLSSSPQAMASVLSIATPASSPKPSNREVLIIRSSRESRA